MSRDASTRHEASWLRGLLAVLTPGAVLAAYRFPITVDLPARESAALGYLAASVAFAAAAVALPTLNRFARVLATLGVLTVAGLALVGSSSTPVAGFVVVGFTVAMVARIWPPASPVHADGPVARDAARGSAVASLALWAVAVPAGWGLRPGPAMLLAVGVAMHSLFALRDAWLERSTWSRTIFAAHALAWMAAAATVWAPSLSLSLLLGAPLSTLVVGPARRGQELDSPAEILLSHPARLLVVTFALLCLGGGFALALPSLSHDGGGLTVVDALFTAISAVCVAGLTVLDIGSRFNAVGQVVVLLLVQLGGLGIMLLSTATVATVGTGGSLRELVTRRGNPLEALQRILVLTFASEAVGAAVLAVLFRNEPEGVWKAIFLSVSAFCNAGFTLGDGSLVAHQGDSLVLLTVATLVVAGGLGPVALLEVPQVLRGRGSLHAKLALFGTFLLLLVATPLVMVLEWNGSMTRMDGADRLVNAFFHAVSPRSAGFFSIDPAQLAPATSLLTMLLTFIGGAPGSTAGGAKVTTVALLGLAVVAAARGASEVRVFGRVVPHRVVYKAAAIVTVGALGVAGGLGLLLITQPLHFEVALFEVVSALGTGGMSVGGTGQLDDLGKILVMSMIFAGRVGPLTLFLLLAGRKAQPAPGVPEEAVEVG